MDGDQQLTTDLVDAIAPVFHEFRREFETELGRFRTELEERLAAIDAEFSECIVDAAQRLQQLINESRRRAEDAITASAEAVRTLAAEVTAETHALPDRMLAQVALLPRPKDGRDGKDGNPGRDGTDGKDGNPGRDGTDGKDGNPGRDGKDGKDGNPARDGKDGKDGKDGRDGFLRDVHEHIPGHFTRPANAQPGEAASGKRLNARLPILPPTIAAGD